jgi:hypothetical protein
MKTSKYRILAALALLPASAQAQFAGDLGVGERIKPLPTNGLPAPNPDVLTPRFPGVPGAKVQRERLLSVVPATWPDEFDPVLSGTVSLPGAPAGDTAWLSNWVSGECGTYLPGNADQGRYLRLSSWVDSMSDHGYFTSREMSDGMRDAFVSAAATSREELQWNLDLGPGSYVRGRPISFSVHAEGRAHYLARVTLTNDGLRVSGPDFVDEHVDLRRTHLWGSELWMRASLDPSRDRLHFYFVYYEEDPQTGGITINEQERVLPFRPPEGSWDGRFEVRARSHATGSCDAHSRVVLEAMTLEAVSIEE